jgi:serine/threonine protein kinase/Tfp pilus assembly protein PilF
MVGTHLGHYEILEKLGAGGMGEVYRAHDERLDRDVALKVLPAGLLADETARRRFRKEALALSKLNHPNIATVHDFDSAEGIDFLVMEYIPGETLSEKVSAGAVPEKETLNLGMQLAEGLAAAHERNVVHRDLKPGNVRLLPDGRLKILDFGLARLVQPMGDETVTESLTETQAAGGTLPYMAPEQLRNEPVDPRSDIWALGVVLYEMAAGTRPFHGQTGFELSTAIMTQAPRALPSQVPTAFKAVIGRCLEKEPGRRYQSAGEVRAALEAIQAGAGAAWVTWRYWLTQRRGLAIAAAGVVLLAVLGALNFDWLHTRLVGGAPRIQSLAVLPLENLSGDPEQEYFADGVTEELTTNLAKISALKVISRTSAMHYKGSKKSLPQIARELAVDALVEGTVLREGGQVRITAQLIQAATDQHLWAESYQRDLRGIMALQGEIARAIAERVQAALTPGERNRMASARLVDPEVYEAYLKGMQHWYKLTSEDMDTALEYFERALKKDPNYAPAYSGVALVWVGRQQMGYAPSREAGPKARAAALKALELDNALTEAHCSLAIVKGFYEWDWAGSDVEYRKAIELNPNYPDARALYSHDLMFTKRPEEAMAQIQRALELDPLNALFQAFYGLDLQFVGRYDEAIAQYRKALKTSPRLPFAHKNIALILYHKGLYADSLAEWKASFAGDRELEEALAQGFAQAGYRGAMHRAADAMAARSRTSYVSFEPVAFLYLSAGENERALEWLEKGLEARDPNLPYISVKPIYNPLRSDPRFQDLLRRMNLPG